MGGPKVDTTPQTQLAQQQQKLAEDLFKQYQQNYAKMLEYEQPLIERTQKILSGDPSLITQAAAPYFTPLTTGYNKAKEDIYESIAPGAARDVALAELSREKNTQIARAMSDIGWQAPEQLASIGAGLGGYGLQQLSGGLQGSQAASSTYQTVLDAQVRQRQAKLGLWTGIAGAAGELASAGIKKSDIRHKDNIEPIAVDLDKLGAIRGVRYRWRDEVSAAPEVGVIAQEIREVLPEVVISGRDGTLMVDYPRITAYLIEVIKAQQKQINNLNAAVFKN